ncbi:MAG: molybdenum cofactor guanylyltransferase [Cyanobacteria bacterium P01_G01_bin.19]
MVDSIKNDITAIVLAGGESSRMGRDKALLVRENQTLLGRICAIASEVGKIVYVVTPWIEKYRSIVPPNCQLIEEKLVLNAKSNTPIIGFCQALYLVKTEWVLLLACDLPYLSSSQVKQWSKALATVLPTEIALLPRHSKGWEPLCGFYRRRCLCSFEAYIDDGGSSFQGWLDRNPVRELLLTDKSCLFNCNTPQDWQSVKDCS